MSELLLAKSADINASDGNGRPALHQVTLGATRRPKPALTAATQRAHNGRVVRTADSESEYRCMLVPPLYCVVPCCTVLYHPCTVLYRAVPCYTTLVLCCTALYRVVPPLYHPCTVLIPCSRRRKL